jgi:hypothetical protein
LATTRGLTEAVQGVAYDSLPPLVTAATEVHPAQVLAGGTLDVAALAAAEDPLAQATSALQSQRDALAALEPSWVGPVAQARASLLDQLTGYESSVSAAHQASVVVPPMLGLDGPRYYFVGFQNPAELRGTGGLLDAFAIVKADHGTISIERTCSNEQLPPVPQLPPGLTPAFLDRYSAQGGATMWLNANLSPDFPEVATAWEAMWQAATGQKLDGALALDPRALAAVLGATGPVTVPALGTVGADRVESLVLHDQYVLPELAADRKQVMLGIGTATITALMSGQASPQALVPALTKAARDGHILVNSTVAGEQDVLAEAGLAAGVDGGFGPFAEAVLVNAGGNKLDSWLQQSLTYHLDRCTPQGRSVTVTVELRNDAPTSGLPDYVTVRSDAPSFATVPGQNRVNVAVLLTRGARLSSATLDGVDVPPALPDGVLPTTPPVVNIGPDGSLVDSPDSAYLDVGVAAGRPAMGMDLELVPGKPRTLVLHVEEPPGVSGAPLLPLQPMVIPAKATADVRACL